MGMKKQSIVIVIFFMLIFTILCGCQEDETPKLETKIVPKEGKWGIYKLNLNNEDITLIYSSENEIEGINIDNLNENLVFCQKIGGEENEHREICIVKIDGNNYKILTDNNVWDLYPTWSPDGTQIAFLSFREDDLDIYKMDADGSNVEKLFDSGAHDADIHWESDKIVFTSNSSIWMINEDGTEPIEITNPPQQGEWGDTNLPFGDYDPRLSKDGQKIIFSRLEDDSSVHGNYNIFTILINGSGETRLTQTGYSQGLTSLSKNGDKIVFIVAAIDDIGKYDIYMMNSDGTNYRDITPEYFPNDFLCHSVVFSNDDSILYFIGQWWET
jgi:Tol biopolymer transport system component